MRASVMNCAEGGPNFGFTLSPIRRRHGVSGRLLEAGPLRLLTRTRHVRSGVVAIATLSWTEAGMRVTFQTGAQLLAANEP